MGRNLPVPRGSSNGRYAQPAAAGKPAGEGKPAAAGKSRLERAGARFEKGDADWPRDPGNRGSREGIPYPVERGAKEKASAKGGECPSQADVGMGLSVPCACGDLRRRYYLAGRPYIDLGDHGFRR